MRLAIVTTHPIQYYAPVFKLLSDRKNINIKVFYTWGDTAKEKFDPGFGKTVAWDIPLLDGYPYEWVKNVSTDPGSHHFGGIVNPELINQLKAWKADAILIFGWAYHSHLKVIRYFKKKIPVYFRGDSTLLDKQRGFKNLFKAIFLKWVYRHIDHAFYVGTNNKAYFKKYGLKDSQLSFAPHAIDNERFAGDKKVEALKIRQNLGIDADATVILFAGKFEPKKAPQLLLDAFLSLNMPGVHLLFSGNGVLENSLKTKAGSNKHVHFPGFQNQSVMPAVYQACDIFCLPSQGPGETWGLAVNEAMACSKAMLVSNKVGCAIDLVIPGLTGDIFRAGDLSDIKVKLEWLIKDKIGLKKLGINAKNRIADWSFNNQVESMVESMVKSMGESNGN
jgi:glycosyltransferase involved in cell wall biosynthesis